MSRGVHASTGTPIDARFPGQWFQAESGLHQNWMRDYDPTTGRYLQADPLGLVDGASVYGYALQSPSKYADPRGECVGLLVYACAAAAGAVVNAAFGILLDFYIGDGCYTWDELARAAAFGAAGGPIGLYGRGAAAGASAAAGYADDGARAAATVVKSGETAATAAGRAAHKAWKPPFGFEKEVRLPSGRRADAVNEAIREVIELKPNNPRAIREGQRQVDRYVQELQETRGGIWTGRVEPYRYENRE